MKMKITKGTTVVEFLHSLTATVLEQEDELKLMQGRLEKSRERLAAARALLDMSPEDRFLPPTAPGRNGRHQTPLNIKAKKAINLAKIQFVDRLVARNPQGLAYKDIFGSLVAEGYSKSKYYGTLHGAVKSGRLKKIGSLYFSGPKAPKIAI